MVRLVGYVTRTRCHFCGGNVYVGSDRFGSYKKCLQCGRDARHKPLVKLFKGEQDNNKSFVPSRQR